MPRGGDWSLAAAVANPDRAGDGPGAHAIGVEAEFLGHRLVNLEEYVSSGDELAVSAALTAVAEIGPAGMTLELITKPARLLDGDVDRIPVEESTAALDGVLNRLAAMTGPTPLSTIFPSPEYRLSSDADGVRVEPPSGPGDVAVSPHYSAGTAVAGLADLLTWLSNRPAAVDVFPARAARLHLADGLDLGRRLAEEMATDPAFAGRAPHTWAATRAAVHGTVAALYLQFAAMSQHLHANAGVSLTKNFSAFNLRHFPDHVVEGTGPEGAAWLRRHSATVMDRFASTFRALDTRGERGDLDPGLLDRRLPRAGTGTPSGAPRPCATGCTAGSGTTRAGAGWVPTRHWASTPCCRSSTATAPRTAPPAWTRPPPSGRCARRGHAPCTSAGRPSPDARTC